MSKICRCSSFFILVSLAVSPLLVRAQTGVFTLNGGAASQSGQTYTATGIDQSCVYVLNSGDLTLSDCTMNKTGDSSDVNASSQYGINAGVLAASNGDISITGGSITTSASGANGLFATGTGSSVSMRQGSITASGNGAHGVDATYGGTITLKDVNITTNGSNASALATDFGGGTVNVTGGTIVAASTASGSNSAGIYSTGTITVSGSTVKSKGDCGGVIDGANSIRLTNVFLTGALHGIKIWNTTPASGRANVTMCGGGITASDGDAFYVTDGAGNAASASINLSGNINFSPGAGYLVNVPDSGEATLASDGAAFSGDMNAGPDADLSVSLGNGTSYAGAVAGAAMTIDSTSMWTVTADSTLTTLTDPKGVSGSSVNNITGNGNNVYYDPDLSVNDYLGGLNYALVGGGYLLPVGGSAGCSLTCAAAASPTSGTAPLSVGFTAAATTSNCTGAASFSWDFGDGATSSEEDPVHDYAADGTYYWKLTVTADDRKCEKSGRITVGDTDECTISCGASAAPSSGEPPLSVLFTAEAAASNCSGEPTFSWSFGDGSVSSERNPSHIYENEGVYNWVMTSSAEDQSCSVAGTVSVEAFHGPIVTSITKAGNPFRLKIIGSGFVSGCEILVDGASVPVTAFRSASYLIAKKGAALKAMIPKGVPVLISVRNPDGTVSNEVGYTRQ